jgi:hypothetical protein
MALEVEDIPWLIICVIMMFALVMGVGVIRESALAAEINTHNLEQEIFAKKLMTELSYQDPLTDRVYFGLIDEKRFTSDYIDSIFGKRNDFAFKVNLTDLDGTKIALDTINNPSEFQLLDTIVGKSEYKRFIKDNYVLVIKKDGKRVPAKMSIVLVYK